MHRFAPLEKVSNQMNQLNMKPALLTAPSSKVSIAPGLNAMKRLLLL
jgi:hypothetical protein